jgi:hypothetical protein
MLRAEYAVARPSSKVNDTVVTDAASLGDAVNTGDNSPAIHATTTSIERRTGALRTDRRRALALLTVTP